MNEYWKIVNMSNGKAEILLYEQIGESFWGDGMGAKRFAEELKGLGDVTQLDVRINSPGGSVFEGNAIHNMLKAHAAKVTVYVDGIAASIASVIAMAGDEIVMPANAMMMVHDPSGVAIGTAEDMAKMAEALTRVKDAIITSYTARTGLPKDEVSELMSDETWLTAEMAVEKGFADTVSGAVEADNLTKHGIDNGWKNVPMELVAASVSGMATPASQEPTQSEDPMDLEELKKKHPALYAQAIELGASNPDASVIDNAVKAEQERVSAILAMGEGLGCDDFVKKLAFEDKATPEVAALALVERAKVARTTMQQKLLDDGVDPVAPSADSGDQTVVIDPNLPLEARVKKMWEVNAVLEGTNERIRDAFLDEEGAVAFMEAEANGQIRILTGRASA